MLTHKGHYNQELFYFSIRSLAAFCSAFASKYHISSLNAFSLCTRIDARFGSFLFSCHHKTGIDVLIFCGKYGKHHPLHDSLEYVQLLYGYNGTIRYPFCHILLRQLRHRLEVEYSHKGQVMLFFVAMVLVGRATNLTIGTDVKMS